MPKFSIIVPIYNIEKYIEKCIDSVLAQGFTDFELILVDDGSPDSCPQICDEYAKKDARVKVIHKKNGGLSSARNAGLAVAEGEYCWMVDGDDYVSPDALEKILPYANGENDIVNVDLVGFPDGKEADFENIKKRRVFVGLADEKTICKLTSQACSTKLLTYVWRNIYRTAFLNEKSLRFEENLCYAEDSAFNMGAYLQAEKVYFADICVYAYRDRDGSISKSRETKFNFSVLRHFELYDKIRDESYEKYCRYPDDAYYADAGEFIIRNTYVYAILNRLYCSTSRNNFFMFRKVSCSEMIRKAFRRFDLNKLKSKSLEWYMFWFVKHRMYLPAFIIYRFFIF